MKGHTLWGGSRAVNIVRGYPRYDKDGNYLGFVHKRDGLPYARPRKEYERSKPYPAHVEHFKALPREKTAIIMMRSKGGYSINQLSKASGRSTSWIYKILRQARDLGVIRFHDNRKSSRKGLLWGCRKRLNSCFTAFTMWMSFICGEDGEPP